VGLKWWGSDCDKQGYQGRRGWVSHSALELGVSPCHWLWEEERRLTLKRSTRSCHQPPPIIVCVRTPFFSPEWMLSVPSVFKNPVTASHLLSRRCGYRTILEKNLFNGVHLVSCAHLTCNGLERPAPCVPYSAWKVYVARLLRSRVIHYGCRVGQPPAQDGGWRKCRGGGGGRGEDGFFAQIMWVKALLVLVNTKLLINSCDCNHKHSHIFKPQLGANTRLIPPDPINDLCSLIGK